MSQFEVGQSGHELGETPLETDGAAHPARRPRPKRTRRKSGKREELLKAAVELFGSRGYEAVSLRDVTAEVGLKPPAFYNHFKSKDELLISAVLAALDMFNTEVVDKDEEHLGPVERLNELIRRHVLYQISNAAFAKANDRLIDSAILDRIGSPGAKQEIRSHMRRYLDILTEIVRDILAERSDTGLDARICALGIGTMCDNVLLWYRPSGSDSPEKVARRMSELARNMLKIGWPESA
ncbi:TetR/AcrR family transcriptional regulator [Sphingobium sp. ZW T5_29]|uniref:TetR/AcrR family transcriptional regulator n=1 Tax=Sphingobium sp. ZW T5_29 TaxID=3378077 RepID=UPI003853FD8B